MEVELTGRAENRRDARGNLLRVGEGWTTSSVCKDKKPQNSNFVGAPKKTRRQKFFAGRGAL